MDAERRPVGPEESWVFQFRERNRLTRDWKSPENTAEPVLQYAWTTMQDLGVLDEPGRVLFLSRNNEMLKVGGENVAPREIEAQVLPHPAVKLVEAVGIPDDRFLGVAATFVGFMTGSEAEDEELIAYCRGRIASFMVPRIIRFAADGERPMTAAKIQRFVLGSRHVAEPASITE